MKPFVAELVGTAILIFFGTSVVANVLLSKSKGQNSGWIVITLGWSMAVFIAVYAVSKFSGAHLNPAVTIADAINTNSWEKLIYVPAQFIGAFIGSALAWLSYKQHFDATEDKDIKLAVFCNAPAIRNPFYNFLTEMIITFVFMFCILMLGNNGESVNLGALNALPVALLVLAIGLSAGGPTGYAINPARDLGPRIMHFILPIKNKRDSDWSYSWIPVLAPICGATFAVIVKKWIM
jgi:glycerol uptake facilitator protein